MRRTDRTILLAVPLIALVVGFYLLVLAPKREQAADLQTQIDGLAGSIAVAEAQIASAEQARENFPKEYAELVALGRAVPEDGDQASLIYDFADVGNDFAVNFRSFEVQTGGSGAPPAPAPAPATEGAPAAEGTPAVQGVPATEAAAAVLPLGATVGPAGLPVTPYTFEFTGNFFDMAGFFGAIDRSVRVKKGKPKVNGRLVTIDAFTMTQDEKNGFPSIAAEFAVTTYVVPDAEGLAAGASPAGPAPVAASATSTVAAPAGGER